MKKQKTHRKMRSELGAGLMEYSIISVILVPVALFVGLTLETTSQHRGQLGVQSSPYLLSCNSQSLLTQGSDECK